MFWPVYQNLEKEFLQLSNYIHISDDQLNVYSMHISDLIIRCSIEIEAISKELYKDINNCSSHDNSNSKSKYLKFDIDCIDFLEKRWKLSEKRIVVSAPSIYFTEEANRILVPLKKANKLGKSGSKWKQAYQALKHDRRESLKLGSIKNLLNSIGSLFILNLYYKDERYDLGRVFMPTMEFDNRVGSELFSVYLFNATNGSWSDNAYDYFNSQKDIVFDMCIYIEKYTDESFIKFYNGLKEDDRVTRESFSRSHEINTFLKNHPDYKFINIPQTCMDAGGKNLLNRIMCFENADVVKNIYKKEAIINKTNIIYPKVV